MGWVGVKSAKWGKGVGRRFHDSHIATSYVTNFSGDNMCPVTESIMVSYL